MNSIRASFAGVLALGLLSIGAAFADPAPTAPLAPSETKTFGDWTVRCYPIASPSPCDMYELLANKQTNQRVMSLSIAYMPAGDRHVIQIAVPLGVYIPNGLVIESDTFTSAVMQYRRCDRAGCYVESLFDNKDVSSLGSAAGSSKIKIVADGGKVFEIPFSLKGYGDAHGAMVDLARKKTAKPANAATPPVTPAPAKP